MSRRCRAVATMLLVALYPIGAGALASHGTPGPVLSLVGGILVLLFLREVLEAESEGGMNARR